MKLKLKLHIFNPIDEDVNVILKLMHWLPTSKDKLLGFYIILFPLNIYILKTHCMFSMMLDPNVLTYWS